MTQDTTRAAFEAQIELPPLPDPYNSLDMGECYTSHQMEQYAESAIAHDRQQRGEPVDAAVAAIRFALEADDGMTWLQYWNEGEFDVCRREWPETPDECFIGADPLHPETVIADADPQPADPKPIKKLINDEWAERLASNGTQPAEPVRGNLEIDDFIAACIARGEMTKEGFLEAKRWVLDNCYPSQPAEPVKVPSDDKYTPLREALESGKESSFHIEATREIIEELLEERDDLLARYGARP